MESSAPATKPTLSTRPSPSFRLRTSSLNSLRLRRVFDLFDHNGDGQITIPEICSALDRLGLSADPSELASVVSAYIRPGRQGLDFDDFHNLHSALGDALFGPDDAGQPESEAESEEERDMAEAFKVFDEDGDGFISAKELQAVLGKLGLPEGRSIGRVEEMIGSVDRNHDGRVDFPEFKSMMRSVAVQSA